MSQQASFGRFGQLALTYCGKFLPLEVLHSAAGHYIGTRDTEGPVSRDSRDYLRSHAAAQRALARGGWSQLASPCRDGRSTTPLQTSNIDLETRVRDMAAMGTGGLRGENPAAA